MNPHVPAWDQLDDKARAEISNVLPQGRHLVGPIPLQRLRELMALTWMRGYGAAVEDRKCPR